MMSVRGFLLYFSAVLFLCGLSFAQESGSPQTTHPSDRQLNATSDTGAKIKSANDPSVQKNSTNQSADPASEFQTLIERSEARVYTAPDGFRLPYRLFMPDNYDGSRKYPLILFLHGGGERGADNLLQLKNDQVLNCIAGENRKKNPAILIAPQCPVNHRWANVDFWTPGAQNLTDPIVEPTDAMKAVIAVMDQLKEEFSVDANRIYATGLSMGGYATCDLAARRPNDIAAYVSLCGGADQKALKMIKGIPGWFFHGDQDKTNLTDRSRIAFRYLSEAGTPVLYDELPGRGHCIWNEVYPRQDWIDWLFRQRKK